MAIGWKILLAFLVYSNLVLCVEQESERDAFRRQIASELISHMDLTVDPCQDIYQYACGNYENLRPIPADQPHYMVYNDIGNMADNSVRKLLEGVPDSSVEGLDNPPQLKAKRFYESCMNREVIDSRGTQPILELLEQLGGWPLLDDEWSHTKMEAEKFLALTNPFYSGSIIVAKISVDHEDSTQHSVVITRNRVTPMTTADLREGYNSTTTRAYRYQIIETLKLFGISSDLAAEHAQELIDFEMRLLGIQSEPRWVQHKDLYTKITLGELSKRFPYFQWKTFLSLAINQTLDDDYVVAVWTMGYFRNLFPILQETKPKLLGNWVMLKIILEHSRYMNQSFLDILAEVDKITKGISQPDPVWTRCLGVTKEHFQNILGAMYVEAYFDQESRDDVRQVAEDIRREIRHLIEEKEWLQEPTKNLTLEKLDTIGFVVGYNDEAVSPDALQKEYKDFAIDDERYFENILNINKIHWQEMLDNFGKPVLKRYSLFLPLEITAAYDRRINKVDIPAAFLQPRNYHKQYPRAFIYGSVGNFIGHEIGHAFDRDGRQFDKTGALKNWWDNASIAAYNEKGECFADYYSQYSLFGHKLNGAISLGETMSDNIGIRAAYFAYKKWWEEHKDTDLAKDEFLPGLDFDNFDLFFLKYAQGFCENIRPEVAHIYVQIAHPPGPTRMRGTFGNNPAFAEQFGCNAHSNCLVW